MTDKTIRMPKAALRKWLKALREGNYLQNTGGALYNEKEGSFCCLGILQHCLTKGYVETRDDTGECFRGYPSIDWLKENGITFVSGNGAETEDPYLPKLGNTASIVNDNSTSFKKIADAIEACTETY
jgi:hypothetical protein